MLTAPRSSDADALPVAAQTIGTPPALRDDASLFLDFDGTLVDLAARPGDVVVDPALQSLIGVLAERLDGRIAIVSGRSIAQLEAFFGQSLIGLALAGSHGSELRGSGVAVAIPTRPPAIDAAERLLTKRYADNPHVVIEHKSLGVGIHYRLAPEVADDARDFADRFAQEHGLFVQPGKMMVELRLPGHDKGTAITALMEQAPFAGHPPIFLGDDLTDEPGFVAALALGGYGVLVGDVRASAARHALPSVAAVRDWLAGDCA